MPKMDMRNDMEPGDEIRDFVDRAISVMERQGELREELKDVFAGPRAEATMPSSSAKSWRRRSATGTTCRKSWRCWTCTGKPSATPRSRLAARYGTGTVLRRLSDLLRELDAQEGPVCVYLLRGSPPGSQWAIHSRQGVAPFTIERLSMDEPDESWRDLI